MSVIIGVKRRCCTMSKFDWKAWLALGATLLGISLATAVTAGESGEQLAKHKEDAKQNEKKQ